ncbi:MAG: hypothetical protein IR164_03240 [Devosia sp.]|uniref:hypothetical protein n=1 Tax=unclassified Devosia TaxID=196773 RepID=UPI0019DCBE88|nr:MULTISPECIES: hypothetical protein [unclassified Devosia]MBF0677940.1 hypothetical protein [Devosia sp.]WEJ34050.1 hypothetical protein NYQ88_04340 [Devosia sp. SD17-2]
MNKLGLPTGPGTADRNDVADPHPTEEEDYDKIPHPGGANPPKDKGIGPNSYAHDGKAAPLSDSKGSGPARAK